MMMAAVRRWFTGTWAEGEGRAPAEVIALRVFFAGLLVFLLAETATTRPHPGLHGRGLVVLVSTLALLAGAILAQPAGVAGSPPGASDEDLEAKAGERRTASTAIWVAADLLLITAAAAALAVTQPNGIWQFGPVYVAIIAAARLEPRLAVALLLVSVTGLMTVTEVYDHGNGAVSLLVSAIPWFLIMRMIRAFRQQRDELASSRAAEARGAAAAERGRIAREMHDVLAHSLSALALSLESTRLLARERGADADLCRALDQAHHLAAGGLQEARRAIAAARDDRLPGPERLQALAEAFREQSGLPVSFDVLGVPRELAPDARLAVYRTAQEALTNVRRHAAAERVEVTLDYQSQQTVLVVADHARAPLPVAVGIAEASSGADAGYGLTGMRERAELLGGELFAGPTADGFRVELRMPW